MKAIFGAAILMAAFVSAGAAAEKDLRAEGAWARATAPSAKTGAVYLTIIDKGEPDELVSATTPMAQSAKLHETTKIGDVARMRAIDALPVTSAGPTMLAPGGYHVMLMGLKAPLVSGQTFPLTLTFKKGGAVDATVAIEAADAGGPQQDKGPGHDKDK